MIRISEKDDRWIEVLTGLNKALRCCRQDETFCEGVTFQQFMVLEAVAGTDALPMGDLHERLGTAKSTTTRIVRPLIDRGLLERAKDPRDSRSIQLSLTPEGRQVHRSVRLCLSQFLEGVVRRIPSSRREPTLKAMNGFIEAVGKTAGDTGCCTIPEGKVFR